MNELDYQRLIVKAVRENGGFAIKLSHRFLAGVPDVLVQMPGCPTSLWEVKLGTKLTKLQEKFLREYKMAGGVGGVIRFTRRGSELFVQVDDWPAKLLPRGHREAILVDEIKWTIKTQIPRT